MDFILRSRPGLKPAESSSMGIELDPEYDSRNNYMISTNHTGASNIPIQR